MKVEGAIHEVISKFAKDFLSGKRDEDKDLLAIWHALIRYAGRIETIRNVDCGYERFSSDFIYKVYTDAYNQTFLELATDVCVTKTKINDIVDELLSATNGERKDDENEGYIILTKEDVERLKAGVKKR